MKRKLKIFFVRFEIDDESEESEEEDLVDSEDIEDDDDDEESAAKRPRLTDLDAQRTLTNNSLPSSTSPLA